MLKPILPVQTERLRLRGTTPGDLEAMYSYKSREDVCRYVPYSPLTRGEIAALLADRWSFTDLTEEDQGMTLVIEERASGHVVGDLVLFWRSAEHELGEIGYMIDPKVAGRGYATEASRELLRIGFEEFSLHRIVAKLDARNDKSAGVLERLGMRREAHHVEHERFKGQWSDLLVFAMLAREWFDDPRA